MGIGSYSYRVAVGKLDTQKNQWCKFPFRSKSEGNRTPMSQLKESQAEGAHPPFLHILFYSGLQWIR